MRIFFFIDLVAGFHLSGPWNAIEKHAHLLKKGSSNADTQALNSSKELPLELDGSTCAVQTTPGRGIGCLLSRPEGLGPEIALKKTNGALGS